MAFPKPDVLIVASGHSAAMYPYGALIDSFPVVVRFQGFELFPVDTARVGEKVDVCFINGSLVAMERVERTLSLLGPRGVRFVWTPSFPVPDRQAHLDAAMRRHGCTYELFPFDQVEALRQTVHGGRHYPSSGCVAVTHYVARAGLVAIHGFDMLDPGIDSFTGTHYYESRPLTNMHDFTAEALYLRRLIARGHVVPLHALATEARG